MKIVGRNERPSHKELLKSVILQQALLSYPDPISISSLEQRLPYTSKTLETYIGRLQRKLIVTMPSSGMIQASASLFME